MKSELPLYDGDGFLRRVQPLDPAELEAIERKARALRANVIAQLLKDFGNWVERSVWRARQRDYVRELSRASDHADLERRMKSLHQPNAV